MPKAAGMQLLLRIRNSPGALALGARSSDDDSPQRAGPLYRLVRRLVNRSHHCVGKVRPMTKRLSDLYTQRTGTEGVHVVE